MENLKSSSTVSDYASLQKFVDEYLEFYEGYTDPFEVDRVLDTYGTDLVCAITDVVDEYIAKNRPISRESYQLLAHILCHAPNIRIKPFTLDNDQ